MSSRFSPSRIGRAWAFGLLAVVLAIPGWAGDLKPASKVIKRSHAPAVVLTEHDRALHVLNRLAFGPRPGDIEKVMNIGVDSWIEQQLQPDNIPDPALDSRLAPYRTLKMQPRDL